MNPAEDNHYFTKATFSMLKKCYNKTVKDKQDRFRFKDRVFLVDYAKYLIEYLEPKFKDKR